MCQLSPYSGISPAASGCGSRSGAGVVQAASLSMEEAVALEKAQHRIVETLEPAETLPAFATPSLADRDGISAAALVSIPASGATPPTCY